MDGVEEDNILYIEGYIFYYCVFSFILLLYGYKWKSFHRHKNLSIFIRKMCEK